MPFYRVQVALRSGMQLAEETDVAVVYANNVADARRIAASGVKGDVSGTWDTATVTELVAPESVWLDWMFHFKLIPGQLDPPGFEFWIKGGTTHTIATIAGLIRDQLLARGLTSDWTSPVLTVATAGDGKGRYKVELDIYPPERLYVDPQPCNGVITNITDEHGTGTAALTMTFNLAAGMVPGLYLLGKKTI